VAPERQNELTRCIQEKLAEATEKVTEKTAEPGHRTPSTPEIPPSLAVAESSTPIVQ
jgi:hypothetical protein